MDLLTQIVALFRDDAPRIMENLRGAIAANDLYNTQLAAHSLKGLVLYFGGEACSAAAARVEALAAGGALTGADEAVRELERQLVRLDEALTIGLTHK